MEVTQLLLDTIAMDDSVRSHAFQSLKKFEQQNREGFLLALVGEIGKATTVENAIDSRIFAANRLKKSIDRSWMSLDRETKDQMTEALLKAISSPEVFIRSTTALVIAKIASVELSNNQFPESLNLLLSDIRQLPAHAKEALLQTLEYLCDNVQVEHVNTILGAIVEVMTVVEGTMPTEEAQVRLAGFDCLKLIASTYYEKLKDYMPDILSYTPTAAEEGEDATAMRAIEFWISVCEKEIGILDSRDHDVTCFYFTKDALFHLLPILLDGKRHITGIDEDNWDVATASVTCFNLFSKVVGENMVDELRRFVATLDQWKVRTTWDWIMNVLMNDPCEKILWLLCGILECFPAPRDMVFSPTWEKIIRVVDQSIKGAHEEFVVKKACQVLLFFTVAHHQIIGIGSHLTPAIKQLSQSLFDVCFKEHFSIELKTAACLSLDQILTCLTDECAFMVVFESFKFSEPSVEKRRKSLGEFTWKWVRTIEDSQGRVTIRIRRRLDDRRETFESYWI